MATNPRLPCGMGLRRGEHERAHRPATNKPHQALRLVTLRDSKLCVCERTFNESRDVAKQVSSFLVEQLLSMKLPDGSTVSHDDQHPTV